MNDTCFIQFNEINEKDYNQNPNRFLNPLMQTKSKFEKILISEGFEEVKNSCFVENLFWDSYFIWKEFEPIDPFYLKYPKRSKSIKEIYPEYYSTVSKMHEINWSKDWPYEFTDEETSLNFIRPSTTPIHHRALHEYSREYKLKGNQFMPKKIFSIEKCFRDDTVDNTHLTEFHTIEGYLIDYNIGLGETVENYSNILTTFGIKKFKFVPAFVPDASPAFEILAYHEKMGRWIEIGGTGLRRAELVLPHGFPEGVNVVGFGLSLERSAMIYYNIDDIRNLDRKTNFI